MSFLKVIGQIVRPLVDAEIEAGAHAASWDAKNDRGEFVSSGVYIYQLRAGDPSTGSGRGVVRTKKKLLAK